MTDRDRHLFAEGLDSSAWHLVLSELTHEARAMIRALLENADLPEAQRRGYVIALTALKKGITTVYEKAGRTMPASLQQELYCYRDDDT